MKMGDNGGEMFSNIQYWGDINGMISIGRVFSVESLDMEGE